MPNEIEIEKLVLKIKELMGRERDGWVSWRRVAREFLGSEEYATALSVVAKMPQYSTLFHANEWHVKLSEAGLNRVVTVDEIPVPANVENAIGLMQASSYDIGQVANCVTQYAAGLRRIYLKVESVFQVTRVNRRYVQAIHVELSDEVVPSDTPVEFRKEGRIISHGKIVGQEPDGGVLYVALEHEISEFDLPVVLSIDRAFLLTRLADRIRGLDEFPVFMQTALYPQQEMTVPIFGDDSRKVADKLAQLLTPWVRFLWGPPGAGKTWALARLARQIAQTNNDDRILIVAPSNRAVDVAVEQLVEQFDNTRLREYVRRRRILRFGYPRKEQILERPELLGPAELDELNNHVKKLSSRILLAERERQAETDLAILRAELLATQEEVKTIVTEHVHNSKIVATTTTLAYLPSSPIKDIEWDTVLVDEVTMVTPAMCTFLASLAQKRFLLAGDPRQLGPIYEEGPMGRQFDYDWMGKDIFDKSGLSQGTRENRIIQIDDARLARITSQRRCAPEIWDKVESLYPEVSNLTEKAWAQELGKLPPKPGKSVVLLDTSEAETAICRKMQGSWQNEFTAELAMEVACTIASEANKRISVAIISPYRAQVRLLRKMIRQEQKADVTPYKQLLIEAGTVHQFQGSDADVVIFDMVDGRGRNEFGALLRGDTGIRLVNVAITRAKGKLIVLADKSWSESHFLNLDNSILQALVTERTQGERLIVILPAGPESAEDRGTESPIERRLLRAINRVENLKQIQTQYRICDEEDTIISRADFAFPDLKYAIYCDGKQWHLRPGRWERDLRQRNKLAEAGWIFSVFTGGQINSDPTTCVAQIVKTYEARLRDINPQRQKHR